MTPLLKCPDCKAPLESFLAKPPQGVDISLERCTRCGGVWGGEGRIQASFGEVAHPQLVGGTTHKSCAFCRILLTPALLPGGLSVEMCSACRGLYLDSGEFQKLGGRARKEPKEARPSQPPPPSPAPARPAQVSTFAKAPVPAPPPQAPEASASFLCVRCGQQKPLREGQAFRDGLACRPCMRAVLEG
jgi:Zn-finger nucleic acid-binding protein/DNA-directed RNA polymerase subunit RPC12/RpoP